MLELCEKVIQGLKIGRLERHQLILKMVYSQIILLSIQGFNLSQISFGVFNPKRWKRRSRETEMYKNLNASYFLLKNLALSVIEVGSYSVSIVNL